MAVPKRKPDKRWRIGPLILEMWLLRTGDGPIPRLDYAYRLRDRNWPENPVFEGDDFSAPEDMGWDRAATELLGFLTLQEGDTEDEFFGKYTPAQIRWRDARAGDVQLDAMAFEEQVSIEEERKWRRERRGEVAPPKKWEPPPRRWGL